MSPPSLKAGDCTVRRAVPLAGTVASASCAAPGDGASAAPAVETAKPSTTAATAAAVETTCFINTPRPNDEGHYSRAHPPTRHHAVNRLSRRRYPSIGLAFALGQ